MNNINVSEVLAESFGLLRRRPKLFFPKLISTAIGAAWFIGLLEGTGSPLYYLASLPLLTFIGFFASVMVAEMVKNSDSENLLQKSFQMSVRKLRPIIISTIFLTLSVVVISLPMSIGLMFYIFYDSILALGFGSLTTLAFSLLFSFMLYFFPISLTEKGSVFKSLVNSKEISFSNKKEVAALTLISFMLIGLAALSQGYLKALGYIGFIAGRLISAIVTTYLFVVSPRYYLEE